MDNSTSPFSTYYGAAFEMGREKANIPPPVNLRGVSTKACIRLTWKPLTIMPIEGYYSYRALSAKDSLEIIANPARYLRLLAKDTASFTLKNIFRHKEFGTLDVYYHLLNIIEQRMKSSPASSITLTGFLGAVENSLEEEDADKTLSRRRTESVGGYLRDVWGIAENRMNIIARGLPAQPSNTNDELVKNLGSDAEENRRVEISSNDWNIIKPVMDEDTLVASSFPLVHFQAIISPTDSLQDRVKGWSLLLWQCDSILVRTRGTNTDFEYLWTIEYERPYSDAIIQATLDVETSNDEHLTVKDTIQVEYVSIVKKRREGIDDTE